MGGGDLRSVYIHSLGPAQRVDRVATNQAVRISGLSQVPVRIIVEQREIVVGEYDLLAPIEGIVFLRSDVAEGIDYQTNMTIRVVLPLRNNRCGWRSSAQSRGGHPLSKRRSPSEYIEIPLLDIAQSVGLN